MPDKLKLILQGMAAPILNALALGLHDIARVDPQAPVIRDEQGVPVAWRLFAFGPFTITKDGQKLQGDFTPEAADTIIGHYAEKGSRIPLDSEHFLYQLAEKYGVPETEVANLLPGGRGTFGFASLEKRDDGLWVADVEYVPLARSLMAEGIFRYFSPVIRGLSDGRLRITSVAFTNTPAIDRLESLAAAAEETAIPADIDSLAASLDAFAASANRSSNKQELNMNKLLTALASLLGMDSIALSDDGAVPEDVVGKIETLAGEHRGLQSLKTGQESFLSAVKDSLHLSDGAGLNEAQGAILGLSEKAATADALKERVDTLVLESETRKRQELIDKGLESGQLTKDLVEKWAKDQDAAALSAFLQHAPVVVPAGKVRTQDLADPDTVALTAEDKEVAEQLGMTHDAFLATKKANLAK